MLVSHLIGVHHQVGSSAGAARCWASGQPTRPVHCGECIRVNSPDRA